MSNGKKTIVIDCGSAVCKAGFAGDKFPSAVFPSIIGRTKYPHVMTPYSKGKEIVFGNEAVSKRGVLKLKYPIDEYGEVTNWDDMEKIWNHMFKEELKVTPGDHEVLLSDTPHRSKFVRERTTQIMFETFNVPAMCVSAQPVLALYATGRLTGIVVDSGHVGTNITPIYDGFVIDYATGYMDLAGRKLTEYLVSMLNEGDHSGRWMRLGTSAEIDMTREIKEKLCRVASGFQKELVEWSSQERYFAPDGQVISIGTERIRCAEALFQPHLARVNDCPGIHKITHECISKCNSTIVKDLYANIVLSGGSTMFTGFNERFLDELSHLAPPTMKIKLRSTKSESSTESKQNLAVWTGGSILASSPSFHQMCVTKQEYEENGPTIIHDKKWVNTNTSNKKTSQKQLQMHL